ncbi:MAG TPA: helix-turn-helix domain-containing protein, partial [Anaerolineales bacterium]
MSIGEQLRQARLAQDISLDQVSQATHIRLHYLEALEADQFDQLPSTAQLRGFIRAYADYLKINSAALVQALEGNLQASPVAAGPPDKLPGTASTSSNSQAIFSHLGQKLRSQRELMGLSLGDVERHTHIRMHYVRALEEGDLSHLPSPVQGRGMLSNYASFLGLNTEAVLLQFADGLQASLHDRQAERNQGASRSSKEETSRIPARPSQLRRLFSMDLFAGGFLIIFLLGFSIWGALRISAINREQDPSPTAPPVSEILLSTQNNGSTAIPSASVVSTIPATLNGAELITGTLEVAMTETPIVIEPTPANANAPVQVYIVAHQRAWMKVSVDGEIAFEGRVMPGSAYSFSG